MVAQLTDQKTVEAANKMIEEMQAQKAALHPEQKE